MNANIKRSPLFKSALDVAEKINSAGRKAYFVGGCVRDSILNTDLHDIDIVTDALPDEVMKIFPNSHPIGAAFGIITVVEGNFPFEVATFREEREYCDGRHPERISYTDNPKLDAIRRDFTVNGLFYDPFKDEILDFAGGLDDIKKGILRTIGSAEERFNEDYLRILRALRFAVKLGFEIAPDLRDAIIKLRSKLKKLSAERIRDELNKMLTGPRPSRAFRLMSEYGVMDEILPEVSALRGVEQPKDYHPEGDVFEHTMLMLDHISYPSIDLAWSILLHDIAKPHTFSVGEDGRPHFYGHEHDGAILAEKIMSRLKLPSASIKRIANAIKNHMRFAHLDKMRPVKLRRVMAEDDFPMELELHRIDCISSNGNTGNYILVLDLLNELKNKTALPPALLNGKDLIACGIKPGPRIGALLHEIQDMQLEGKINSREDALAVLKNIAESDTGKR